MSFTYIERRVSYVSCISFPQIPSECVTFMSLESFSVQFFFLKTSLLYALLAVFYYKITACSFPVLFWLYANYEGYGTLLHSSQGSRTGSSYSQYTIVESSQEGWSKSLFPATMETEAGGPLEFKSSRM